MSECEGLLRGRRLSWSIYWVASSSYQENVDVWVCPWRLQSIVACLKKIINGGILVRAEMDQTMP